MQEKRVITLVGRNLQSSGLPMEIGVSGIAASRTIPVSAGSMGCVPYPPDLFSRPKRRHSLFVALWIRDHHVQLDLTERVGISL
jgi:hypothetical protein